MSIIRGFSSVFCKVINNGKQQTAVVSLLNTPFTQIIKEKVQLKSHIHYLQPGTEVTLVDISNETSNMTGGHRGQKSNIQAGYREQSLK